MAQKAIKQLAARNISTLNTLHLISLIVHALYIISRFLIFRGSLTRNTWLLYVVLSAPAVIIELFLEKNSRPTYGPDGDIKRAGDDLQAKGLTEFMLDVLYWTWGCIFLAAVAGNVMWWLWAVVPVYSAWAAFGAFTGVRNTLTGLGGAGQPGAEAEGVQAAGSGSKRQQKLEKRGGQRVQYR